MKNQEIAETIRIPSEGIEYRESPTKPSGVGIEAPRQAVGQRTGKIFAAS